MIRPEDLKYDERGLLPCIVQDVATGEVLTLAWQSREALERTLRSGQATFWRSAGLGTALYLVRSSIHHSIAATASGELITHLSSLGSVIYSAPKGNR